MVLGGLVGTATVTTQGLLRRLRHDAKGGDFYLATSGDLDLATSGDSFMATDTARELVHPLGRRWLHVCSVAEAARRLAAPVELDCDLLVASSWVHDIGYAPELHATGCHAVDGARYLRQHGWDERVVSLVAHHSCARFEASIRGLVDELADFPRPPAEYEDALCFCDMTNGPAGAPVDASDRLDEIQER